MTEKATHEIEVDEDLKYSDIHTVENIVTQDCDFFIEGWVQKKKSDALRSCNKSKIIIKQSQYHRFFDDIGFFHAVCSDCIELPRHSAYSIKDNTLYEKIIFSCVIFSSLGTEKLCAVLPMAEYLFSPIA